MDDFKVGDRVRLKTGCPGSGMTAGMLGKLVVCARRNKLHFHAKVEGIGAAVPTDPDWYHDNHYTCNNKGRWELLSVHNYRVTNPRESFFEEMRDELDKLFPKGKCSERGAALVLNAYANILFDKYIQ